MGSSTEKVSELCVGTPAEGALGVGALNGESGFGPRKRLSEGEGRLQIQSGIFRRRSLGS